MSFLDHKIYVFDFDGVVCDSMDECLITSWNAWQRYLHGMNSQVVNKCEAIPEDEQRHFRALRWYARGAGEYYALWSAFQRKMTFNSQAEFQVWSEETLKAHDAYAQIFVEFRKKIRAEEEKAWVELHGMYSEAVEAIRKLLAEQRCFIATLKDKTSVRLLLRYQGVEVDESLVYDREDITSKLEALQDIQRKQSLEKQDIAFIDDNVPHLVPTHQEGFPSYLSAWGALVEERLERVSEYKIPIVTLKQLTSL
jgi:phosphoglycolate phosphatase-like HAD superfamily hydrolase